MNEEHDVIAEIREVNEQISTLRERTNRETAALRARRARLIREARQEGWSLGRLAEELGVSRVRVQQFEAGNGER